MLTITETTKRQGRVGILPNIASAKDAQESITRIRNDWQARGRRVISTALGLIVEATATAEEIEYKTELAHAA